MRSRRAFHLNVWIGIAFEAGLGMLALVLAFCLSLSPWNDIHFDLLPLLGSLVATIPLLAALGILLGSNWELVRELRHFVDDFVLPMFAEARVWELVLLCTAAGIGEELMFRGLLQPIFCQVLGLQLGVILVNVLFGLMHPFSIAYLVLASLIGLYLSVLFVATDNLLVPMLVHGLYDFVALLWMMRLRRKAFR